MAKQEHSVVVQRTIKSSLGADVTIYCPGVGDSNLTAFFDGYNKSLEIEQNVEEFERAEIDRRAIARHDNGEHVLPEDELVKIQERVAAREKAAKKSTPAKPAAKKTTAAKPAGKKVARKK